MFSPSSPRRSLLQLPSKKTISSQLMCKTKAAILAAQPRPRSRSHSSSSTAASRSGGFPTASSSDSHLPPTATGAAFSSLPSSASKASSSASTTLASLHEALPEAPVLYTFSDLSSATGNFLSNRLHATSTGFRCSLRGKDAVVYRRRFRGPDPAALPYRLAALAKCHHSSLVPLLGACLSGDQVYLVHEFAPGASLAECLRNPRNPNYTPLSTWISRMQVAYDLAQGLQYIHFHSSVAAGVHNRLKSSSVIVTEPQLRARICHFGAADLAREIPASAAKADGKADPIRSLPVWVGRAGSSRMRIEGSMGYMAPELLAGGVISRRSDVFAFGVVLLELLSGEKPLKHRFGSEDGRCLERVSLIETAREAIGTEEAKEEERRGRVRRWVDRRLRDSFPVEAAEGLMRVALQCVEAEAEARPDMTCVAGRVSKLFLESEAWAETVKPPADFSVSMAPR